MDAKRNTSRELQPDKEESTEMEGLDLESVNQIAALHRRIGSRAITAKLRLAVIRATARGI
jgi:hypothetical protein